MRHNALARPGYSTATDRHTAGAIIIAESTDADAACRFSPQQHSNFKDCKGAVEDITYVLLMLVDGWGHFTNCTLIAHVFGVKPTCSVLGFLRGH